MELFTCTWSRVKRKSLSIVVSQLMIAMLSCQQENQPLDETIKAENARITEQFSPVDTRITGDYEVRGGTLHFRDSDAFERTRNALAKMSHGERLKFAEAIGFKSLLFYRDEFIAVSEAATSEAAFEASLVKYADIVTRDETQTVIFNVQSPWLASYLDRTGVVYIGKILYRFGDRD